MPEVTSFAPGFPTWAELASPDPERSKDFYCDLFGWYSYTLTSDMGEYEMFTLGGVQGPEVAGMQTLADDSLPSSWTCYFRTADMAASLDAVRRAGGLVLVDSLDVADLGQLSVCSDPEGADFALWYPYHLQGAGVVDEPAAMCWVELACRDIEGARRFYGEVFGWRSVERDYHRPVYINWKVGDWSVAGMVPMDEHWPPGYPAHWIPYFWVSDCDESAAAAAELGGRVHIPPTDIKPGRFSVITDPTDARLALLTPAVEDRAAVRARP
ncbi:VOC family protein [Actinomadura sp.]|jgi:predicted enzyme related to lactoylglutathione lyase|uniref:VOC family protein n=1 Tax=Actinomadura sp. TaxID=1989 RepID=UPI0033579E63